MGYFVRLYVGFVLILGIMLKTEGIMLSSQTYEKYVFCFNCTGLKSMVTTLLQFGMVGYPFVLPGK